MTSLLKQWKTSDLHETKQIIYHSKGIDKNYAKTFIESEPVCQKLWAFFSNFGFFFRCQLTVIRTQDANVENVLFCTNSAFNIRKSHKISGGHAFYF